MTSANDKERDRALEEAAIRAENYAAHNEDNEAYERQAASLDIAESIRALKSRPAQKEEKCQEK